MKQIGAFVAAILFSCSFAFATPTDIDANGNMQNTNTPATCTEPVLGAYEGPVNFEAKWTPNNIQLRWYNENTQLTVQNTANSCTYDSTLTAPATPPTRIGYDFAGWTLRFSVPDGYTELEYIQSSGTQYINTGFVPTADYKHTIVFEALSTATGYLCGVGTSTGRSGNVKLSNNSIIGIYGGVSSATAVASSGTLISGKNTLIMDLHSNAVSPISLNGTNINNQNSPTMTSNNVLTLFGTAGASPVPLRIYSDKIEQNGVMVRNFIPAKNSSNIIGMYDTVSETFFTNAGSGTFTAGPAVN